NASFIYGSIALGLIQLITIGLDFAECINSQFIKCGTKYGFNNIAVSHLLVTQISLWIMNFNVHFGPCGFRNFVSSRQANETNTANSDVKKKDHLFPSTFADMLLPIIHHFQILIAFVLITIWISSNERKSLYLRVAASDTINNPIYSSTVEKGSGKGFFLGLLIISTSIIVLLHANSEILVTTHIVIQGLSAIAAFIGLIMKGKQHKGVHKISVQFFHRLHNETMLAFTLFSSYFCGISITVNNVVSLSFDVSQLFDAFFLLIQTTFQTLVLRSKGRNEEKTRDIFAFLILTNFSLWILEVTQIAASIPEKGAFTFQVLPDIFVSFSRFYFSTLFFHFWKSK
ncbi:hypothetical protein B4U80_06093, partial [Leptotrombidium deliense]